MRAETAAHPPGRHYVTVSLSQMLRLCAEARRKDLAIILVIIIVPIIYDRKQICQHRMKNRKMLHKKQGRRMGGKQGKSEKIRIKSDAPRPDKMKGYKIKKDIDKEKHG